MAGKDPVAGRFRVKGGGHLQHKRRRYADGEIVDMDTSRDRGLVESGRLVYVGPSLEVDGPGKGKGKPS